jgi:hypothetical protein
MDEYIFPLHGVFRARGVNISQKKEVIDIDNQNILDEFDKDKVYKAELKKLKDILKNIPKDKMKVTESLIDQAAFMFATLKELSLYIDKDGAVAADGKGGIKESPAIRSYTGLINRYSNTIKQLLDLLPKNLSEPVKEEQDKLLDFIKNK